MISCILLMRKFYRCLEESRRKEDETMYIPEFWCGVAATIIVEVAILVIVAVWPSRKSKKS